MRAILALALITALPAFAPPAFAQAGSGGNALTLLPPLDDLNIAEVEMLGNDNKLTIGQFAPAGASEPNRVEVRISGDRNGAGPSSSLDPAPLIAGLPWGSLTQRGMGNSMSLSVGGTQNLFAVTQSGAGNALLATIAGTGNRAAVSQTGTGNIAGLSQTGSGNSVSITQSSW